MIYKIAINSTANATIFDKSFIEKLESYGTVQFLFINMEEMIKNRKQLCYYQNKNKYVKRENLSKYLNENDFNFFIDSNLSTLNEIKEKNKYILNIYYKNIEKNEDHLLANNLDDILQIIQETDISAFI